MRKEPVQKKPKFFKQCDCGVNYSASEWQELPVFERTSLMSGAVLESKTCTGCGNAVSILAAPDAPLVEALGEGLEMETPQGGGSIRS